MLSQAAIYKRILDSFLDTQCTIIQSVWPGDSWRRGQMLVDNMARINHY